MGDLSYSRQHSKQASKLLPTVETGHGGMQEGAGHGWAI